MSMLLAFMTMVAPTVQAQQSASKPDADILVYSVRQGDNIFTLGEKYFIGRSDYLLVQKLNHIDQPRRLRIGEKLRIPRRILKTESVGGEIVAFRGTVGLIRGATQILVKPGAKISEGMVVVTRAKSFITVEMPDGSRFSLPSNSRVVINRLRRTLINGFVDRAFRLENGRSDWDVTPSKGNSFTITTPVATTAVRGTGFRVSYDASAMTLGVLEGTVALSGAVKTDVMAVTAGNGAAVAAGEKTLSATLVPAPNILRPGAMQKGAELSFAVQPVPGATSYGFALAADAGFIDQFANERSTNPEAVFETIPSGTYFVRTTAFDANGVEGLANTYSFDRQLNTVEAETPQIGGVNGRKDYLFRWRGAGGGVGEYRFILSRDEAGMDHVVDRAGLKTTNITITDLPQGTYYWRILSMRFENDKFSESVTKPQKLQIGESK